VKRVYVRSEFLQAWGAITHYITLILQYYTVILGWLFKRFAVSWGCRGFWRWQSLMEPEFI
jgi:SNF family Na+-dependent transporter